MATPTWRPTTGTSGSYFSNGDHVISLTQSWTLSNWSSSKLELELLSCHEIWNSSGPGFDCCNSRSDSSGWYTTYLSIWHDRLYYSGMTIRLVLRGSISPLQCFCSTLSTLLYTFLLECHNTGGHRDSLSLRNISHLLHLSPSSPISTLIPDLRVESLGWQYVAWYVLMEFIWTEKLISSYWEIMIFYDVLYQNHFVRM